MNISIQSTCDEIEDGQGLSFVCDQCNKMFKKFGLMCLQGIYICIYIYIYVYIFIDKNDNIDKLFSVTFVTENRPEPTEKTLRGISVK